MIQIEGRIGQGGSTPRLHHNYLRTSMLDRLIDIFIKWFNIKEKPQVKYLSGVGKSSNYDGGELGSTDVDRGE